MFLYTVVPLDQVFSEDGGPELVEVVRGQMRLLVAPAGPARGRVVRMISSDPFDYLEPAYQPGAFITLHHAELPHDPVTEGDEPCGSS